MNFLFLLLVVSCRASYYLPFGGFYLMDIDRFVHNDPSRIRVMPVKTRLEERIRLIKQQLFGEADAKSAAEVSKLPLSWKSLS